MATMLEEMAQAEAREYHDRFGVEAAWRVLGRLAHLISNEGEDENSRRVRVSIRSFEILEEDYDV